MDKELVIRATLYWQTGLPFVLFGFTKTQKASKDHNTQLHDSIDITETITVNIG
jgi:hypothetical protein